MNNHKEEPNFWVLFSCWLVCAVVCALFFFCFPTEVKAETRVMKVTAYCGCRQCNGKWYGCPTASGTDYVEGRTIAVYRPQIPFGTHVLINGHEYIAEDSGKHIGYDCIDLFMEDHNRANDWGIRYVEVSW